jgi:hypothetical protein
MTHLGSESTRVGIRLSQGRPRAAWRLTGIMLPIKGLCECAAPAFSHILTFSHGLVRILKTGMRRQLPVRGIRGEAGGPRGFTRRVGPRSTWEGHRLAFAPPTRDEQPCSPATRSRVSVQPNLHTDHPLSGKPGAIHSSLPMSHRS